MPTLVCPVCGRGESHTYLLTTTGGSGPPATRELVISPPG